MTSCIAQNKEKDTYVVIETRFGDITLKLYDDTPRHRDNFLKLVKEGTYNGTLFHRVIENFMIQGGDPTSKNAPAGKQLGTGDMGYTIPAEIVYPVHFHKKGALAAARTGDEVNPKKESSGSQFYIVTGTVISPGQIASLENRMTKQKEQKIFERLVGEHRAEVMQLRKNRDKEGLYELQEKLIAQTQLEMKESGPVQLTAEQREAYTTIGGAPHLDGEYTVFGEVVDGLDVIDRIQKVSTDRSDRPKDDIKMTLKIVEK
ncbi:peptidylprolyl isomerase [Gabonia massiliensis]|jgi:peptidyl-prolyl cis-trans isomerase|uniref:peptidylprolyl isomerase n=1 Tax=Gabonia massiliensis TaxID=1686296 RepID=UPI000ABFAD3E|nr:peptidylprolyl isomerase [Gabonia massiliensis]